MDDSSFQKLCNELIERVADLIGADLFGKENMTLIENGELREIRIDPDYVDIIFNAALAFEDGAPGYKDISMDALVTKCALALHKKALSDARECVMMLLIKNKEANECIDRYEKVIKDRIETIKKSMEKLKARKDALSRKTTL